MAMLQNDTEVVSISLAEDCLLPKLFRVRDLIALANLAIKPVGHFSSLLPAFSYLDETNGTHKKL